MSGLYQLTSLCWIQQSRVYATHSSVLFDGLDAFLVDPGVAPDELAAIEAFLHEHDARLRGLVVTHAHWDHLLGPSVFPDTPVIAHRRYLEVMAQHGEDLRHQVAHWAQAEGLSLAFEVPRPTFLFDQAMVLHTGHMTVQLLAAPGHAPDHCVLYEPAAGVLLAGDMLSDIEVPMVMDSFPAYMDTLRTLRQMDVRVLVPGHGSPTGDPAEIARRFAQDLAYLTQVWDCVGEALAAGADLPETRQRCAGIRFAQPDTYPNAHRWNIEQAYLELGGEAGPNVGWAQDWKVGES